MPDLTRLDESLGERLSLDEYRRDFRARQWTIEGRESWKLERAQHFIEPGFPSWDAFARGDWDTALRPADDEREWIEEFSARAERKRIRLYTELDRRPEALDPWADALHHLTGFTDPAAARLRARIEHALHP